MRGKRFAILFIAAGVAAWTLPHVSEARGGARAGGGARGGGGGFSRGGGGGGGGGNYGSIRNSTRPATRDLGRPAGDLGRPAVGDRSRPPQDSFRDREPGGFPSQADRPMVREDRPADRQPSVQDRASGLSPEQRDRLKDRAASLTPEQKQELRRKYEGSGLTADQLPARNPDQAREDWQEWRDQSREDWQDWYEDEYDDHWDDHYHSHWWYGYPVSTVSYSFYIDDSPPCQRTVVVNQPGGASSTYYYCNSVWYQPAYAGGDVKYVVAAPPAGAELSTLVEPLSVTVGGQEYFVSNHVFYQRITRNGQLVYVTVDAPPGAKVPTIPQYAVEVEHKGQSYYRFDRIFYQRQADGFVVVANPGV